MAMMRVTSVERFHNIPHTTGFPVEHAGNDRSFRFEWLEVVIAPQMEEIEADRRAHWWYGHDIWTSIYRSPMQGSWEWGKLVAVLLSSATRKEQLARLVGFPAYEIKYKGSE